VLERLQMKPDSKKIVFHRGKGCTFCSNTGYKGRVGISESLVLSPKIKELIAEKAQEHVIKEQARKENMKTLRENGMLCVLDGTTTVEEILRVTVGDQDLPA